MTQQQQQMQQLQPPSDAARLFAVEKDVAGLKESMTALGATVTEGFRSISADMKARGTTNWQPVQIGLTIMTIAGGIFFTWVNSNTGRLETAIAKVESRTEAYVPRQDLEARFAVITQRRDDLQRLSDARVERIERDLDGVTKQVVPRGEHDSYRQLQIRDYDLLRNRLDRVEGRFEKKSDGLARDLEKLEDRTLSRSEALSRNDAQDRAVGTLRTEVDEHVRAFNERQQRRIDALEAPLLRPRP